MYYGQKDITLGNTENLINEKYYKKARKMWTSMIQRCYDEKLHEKEGTYKNCIICDEWKTFTNFYNWFKNHYYELENESVQLDKDILLKGNKIYCPEYCCFVPHTINSLFTKSNKSRGKYPIGVHWVKRDSYFCAQCCDGNKNTIRLGVFYDPISAFYAYKECKEKVIKNIANKYKDVIEPRVYDAMMKYEVEITD